jgi:hypothetical protein
VAAADPQNLAIAKSEFSRVLQEDDICEYPLSVTMQIIQEVLEVDNEADPETEGLINYLVLLLEHYLNRRRNVFTITGKDEASASEVAEFDKQYFGLDEMTRLKENQETICKQESMGSEPDPTLVVSAHKVSSFVEEECEETVQKAVNGRIFADKDISHSIQADELQDTNSSQKHQNVQ